MLSTASRLSGAGVMVVLLALSAGAQPGSALPPLPELRFAEIPAASQSRYAGDRFSYMEAGNPGAFPVVLLHGAGGNSMHWRFQLAGLSDRYHVIAWNAPGYMLTDNFVKDAPGCRDYADALNDFVGALRLERFHLIGQSSGTRVAECYVIHYPGRVARLALIGTLITGPGLPRNASTEARTRLVAAREQSIAGGGYAFGSQRARLAGLLGSAASAEVTAAEQDAQRATDRRGFVQWSRFEAFDDTYAPALGDRFTMPVLLVKGSEDKAAPADQHDAILIKALPHARQEIVQGSAHLVEVTAPTRVNDLLRAFFAGRTLP